jgi:hypothetical protein
MIKYQMIYLLKRLRLLRFSCGKNRKDILSLSRMARFNPLLFLLDADFFVGGFVVIQEIGLK